MQRTVQNIAGNNETYGVGWSAPFGVSVKVTPTHFSIANGDKQVLSVIFNATANNFVASFASFGKIGSGFTISCRMILECLIYYP